MTKETSIQTGLWSSASPILESVFIKDSTIQEDGSDGVHPVE